jgi:hypothetical protein
MSQHTTVQVNLGFYEYLTILSKQITRACKAIEQTNADITRVLDTGATAESTHLRYLFGVLQARIFELDELSRRWRQYSIEVEVSEK